MTDRYVLIGQTPVPEPDLFTWGRFLEEESRVVKQEWVGNVWVSTVFLGLDHRMFGFKGPPLLFETMAFYDLGDADRTCLDMQYRCSTWLEAEQQHQRAMLEAEDIWFQLRATGAAIREWWREFKHYSYWLLRPNHPDPFSRGPCIQCWRIRHQHPEFF